jgi:hypothetical protein
MKCSETVIHLNKKESQRLLLALDGPPKPPTRHAIAALHRYRTTVISDANPALPPPQEDGRGTH